ncbi:CYTH domain-containing protein, partial [Streptococcus suis]
MSPSLQTNHYIDTPDLDMKYPRFSLRSRPFEDSADLTLNLRQGVGNR